MFDSKYNVTNGSDNPFESIGSKFSALMTSTLSLKLGGSFFIAISEISKWVALGILNTSFANSTRLSLQASLLSQPILL